jgi:hypothetical protein
VRKDLHVDPRAVVAVLLKRISDLTYENAVLAAAVDQLQAQLARAQSPDIQGSLPASESSLPENGDPNGYRDSRA